MGEAANTDKAPKKSFIKGLRAEFRKVVWPDQETVARQTIVVFVASVALGLIIGLMDLGMKFGIDSLLSLAK